MEQPPAAAAAPPRMEQPPATAAASPAPARRRRSGERQHRGHRAQCLLRIFGIGRGSRRRGPEPVEAGDQAAKPTGAVAAEASAPSEEAPEPRPAGRATKKAPGPPPPPKRGGAGSTPAPKAGAASLQWPCPSPRWQPDRVVNWQPIRQVGRLEGSIWQQVCREIEERGFKPLPSEQLNRAFMRSASTPGAWKKTQAAQRKRALSAGAALNADILYAQLARQGCSSIADIPWVLGGSPSHASRHRERSHSVDSRSSSSSSSSSSSGSDADESETEKQCKEPVLPLPDTVLEKLFQLLQTAEGAEALICREERQQQDEDSLTLAPPEQFLRELLVRAGPLPELQSRVQMALNITRFPAEADRIDRDIKLGLEASQAILGSRALPVLLEGMLTLGNYVNKASSALGGALGVSLDSLARLAHTRCHGKVREEQALDRQVPACPENALFLLVAQLQEMHDCNFLPSLVSDLRQCVAAKDVDPSDLRAGVHRCESQVSAVQQKLKDVIAGDSHAEPPALRPTRLAAFLEQAQPRLAGLRARLAELEAAAVALQKYFAEPGESTLPAMLRSLVSLLEALPRPRPAAAARRGGTAAPQRRPARKAARAKQLVKQKTLKTPGRPGAPGLSPRPAAGARAEPAPVPAPLPAAASVPKLALGRSTEEPDAGAGLALKAPRRPVVPPLQMPRASSPPAGGEAPAQAIAPACCGPPVAASSRSPTRLSAAFRMTSPPSKPQRAESADSNSTTTSDDRAVASAKSQRADDGTPQAPCTERTAATPKLALRRQLTRGDTAEFLTPTSRSPAAYHRTPPTTASTRSATPSEAAWAKEATYRSCANSGESTAASTLRTPASTARFASRHQSRKLTDILMSVSKTPRSSAIASVPGSFEA